MNVENFVHFIKDFSQLYHLPYEELKSMVIQYPFSSNLHFLLLIKSHQEQHKDFEKNLRTAAVYSKDRTFLHQILRELDIKQEEIEHFELAEDYLELKDLSNLEEQLEPISLDNLFPEEAEEDNANEIFQTLSEASTEEEQAPITDLLSEEISVNLPSFDLTSEQTLSEENQSNKEQEAFQNIKEIPVNTPQEEVFFNGNTENESVKDDNAQPFESEIRTTELPPPLDQPELNEERMKTTMNNQSPMPTPKSSFSSWVQQFQPVHIRMQLSDLMESKKREDAEMAQRQRKKKKKKVKDQIVLFAEKSLKESNDLASETLAELLVVQQQYDKAIQMYHRLILKFPEKSSYFAGKIEKLKNL